MKSLIHSWNWEAPLAELQHISVHWFAVILAYFECKPNTMLRKKKIKLLLLVREKKAFPHSFPMTLKFSFAKIKRAHLKWLPVKIWNCSSFLFFFFQKTQLLSPVHANTKAFRSCSFDTIYIVLTCHLVDQQHLPWNLTVLLLFLQQVPCSDSSLHSF